MRQSYEHSPAGSSVVGSNHSNSGKRQLENSVRETIIETQVICSRKGLSFGSKDYSKELKTVKCTSFLGQTSYFRFEASMIPKD